jgi:mannose-binding lectin 2
MTAKNWIIEFQFKIHGVGTKVYGDGFALYVVKNAPNDGDLFQGGTSRTYSLSR